MTDPLSATYQSGSATLRPEAEAEMEGLGITRVPVGSPEFPSTISTGGSFVIRTCTMPSRRQRWRKPAKRDQIKLSRQPIGE